MSHRDIVRAQLLIDEDLRLKPYKDSLGLITIGVGRCLDTKGITRQEAFALLDNDIADAERDCAALFPSFDQLSENRRAVLLNMAFNIGRERLSGFRLFRQAIDSGDWGRAAQEMLASRWAEQTGIRAKRLAAQMIAG